MKLGAPTSARSPSSSFTTRSIQCLKVAFRSGKASLSVYSWGGFTLTLIW